MDYPWHTDDPRRFGDPGEGGIRCLDCAEAQGLALGSELTDTEINQFGGVHCGSCGRQWPASHMEALRCGCPTCVANVAPPS